MTSVLLVDDDPGLSDILSRSLRARDLEVIRSSTGEGGVESARRDHPDVVIVDLGLPKMSGMNVISEIRSWSHVPIVVLSARHEENAKVDALNAGADDYVVKPFGIDEFVARLHAAIRRGIRPDGVTLIEAGDLTFDMFGKVVKRAGSEVRLTPTEWRLLEALIREEPNVVSHEELLSAGWGPGSHAPVEYARVYLAAIRRKLEDDPSKPAHIVTEPGRGYRFIKGDSRV